MKRKVLLSCGLLLVFAAGLTLYAAWKSKETEEMSDRTLEYFLGLGLIKREDAADVTWAHAVNSRSKLSQALQDSTLMLEADILMRGLDPKEPIMAHPPQTDSDITLGAWLQELKTNQKGIKLDFKSLDAVAPSVQLLEQILGRSSRPVWVNADVLPGPGGLASPLEPHGLDAVAPSVQLLEQILGRSSRPVWVNADVLPGPGGLASPLDPQGFLQAVGTLPPDTVLSLGWTTGWTRGAQNPGYSWEMVREMEQICRSVKNPVTFPVRAALMEQSEAQLLWLLQQSHRYSLTVWTGQSDAFRAEDLLQFRKQLEPHRVYYDLPDELKIKLAQTNFKE